MRIKWLDGLALLKASFRVMFANKSLFALPILSLAMMLGAALLFFAPIVLSPNGAALNESSHWKKAAGMIFTEESIARFSEARRERSRRSGDALRLNMTGFLYLGAFYMTCVFLATFLNTVLYHEILKALSGEAVSLRSGFAFASSRIAPILAWSLLAGLAGLLLRHLEENFGWIGRWVIRWIGVGWSAASIFVIPALVESQEENNPIALLRQSAKTLRRTWGETIVGLGGISVGGALLIALLVAAFIAFNAAAIALGSPRILLAMIPVWVAGLLSVSFISSLVTHVYICALYIYAVSGQAPAPFTAEMMRQAWKRR